jgi:integrating conjugative element membrane protein (TIGR03745 family)
MQRPNTLKTAYQGVQAHLRTNRQRIVLHVTSLILGAGTTGALAQGLPTTAPPSRGSTDGDYISLMQDYAFDIGVFIGLALATLAMIIVVKNTMGAYSEVQDGKGTWGQLGINFGAGVLLLVFIVFLLTEAATIL